MVKHCPYGHPLNKYYVQGAMHGGEVICSRSQRQLRAQVGIEPPTLALGAQDPI